MKSKLERWVKILRAENADTDDPSSVIADIIMEMEDTIRQITPLDSFVDPATKRIKKGHIQSRGILW